MSNLFKLDDWVTIVHMNPIWDPDFVLWYENLSEKKLRVLGQSPMYEKFLLETPGYYNGVVHISKKNLKLYSQKQSVDIMKLIREAAGRG